MRAQCVADSHSPEFETLCKWSCLTADDERDDFTALVPRDVFSESSGVPVAHIQQKITELVVLFSVRVNGVYQ